MVRSGAFGRASGLLSSCRSLCRSALAAQEVSLSVFPSLTCFDPSREIRPLWDAPGPSRARSCCRGSGAAVRTRREGNYVKPPPPPPPIPIPVNPAGANPAEGNRDQLLGLDKNSSGTKSPAPGGTCCPSVGHGDVPGDTRVQRTPWGEQSRDESCLTVLRALGLHHQGLWCCSSRL